MSDVRDNSRRIEVKGVDSATVSSVFASVSSTQLAASNANRRGLTLFNDSTETAYVKFGSSASSTSFTARLMPYDYYEMPAPIYTGTVHGLWTNSIGSMRVTEF